MAPKPETKLRAKIVKAIEREYPNDYVAHPHGSMYGSGMLDLVICHEEADSDDEQYGIFVSLEIKMPGRKNRVSDLQARHIERIRHAGGVAEVVTTVEDALEVLRGI